MWAKRDAHLQRVRLEPVLEEEAEERLAFLSNTVDKSIRSRVFLLSHARVCLHFVTPIPHLPVCLAVTT